VQRAHDVAEGAAGLFGQQAATALEHQRLAVPAYVGDQLDPVAGPYQGAAAGLVGQGMEVADLGYRQAVSDIAGPGFEDAAVFALVDGFVEIAGNR